MKLILQNRWKINKNILTYYGLRAKPYTTRNKIKISAHTAKWINGLDGKQYIDFKNLNSVQKKLVNQKIVVDIVDFKVTPQSIGEAKFCKKCCANDYTIPGLELDNESICPICASGAEMDKLNSILPIKNEIPSSPKSQYDVALFYTGGKDSSYLLYYLAKVKNLRVLALTWKIPFISESAEKSINNAKKILTSVDFVEWQLSSNSIKSFYNELYSLQENVCACPSMAYVLFYPILSSFDVPYVVLGNEPAQVKNLYFNHLAPKIAFKYYNSKAIKFAINVGRLAMLKAPINMAQFAFVKVMRQLCVKPNIFAKIAGYENAEIINVCKALDKLPQLKSSLKRQINYSDRHGKIASLVQINFDDIFEGGVYDWRSAKEIIAKELNWVDVSEKDKGLHTSCKVECAKDYSQYIRFRNMQSTTIPFSAVELAIASSKLTLSRDEAIAEIKAVSGLGLCRPQEHCLMEEFCNKK